MREAQTALYWLLPVKFGTVTAWKPPTVVVIQLLEFMLEPLVEPELLEPLPVVFVMVPVDPVPELLVEPLLPVPVVLDIVPVLPVEPELPVPLVDPLLLVPELLLEPEPLLELLMSLLIQPWSDVAVVVTSWRSSTM